MNHSTLEQVLQQALALHRQGQFDQAELLYQKVIKIQPNNFSALGLLGAIALQRGQYQQAVPLLEKSLSVNSKQVGAYSNLGLALDGLQRYEDALRNYDCALALEPTNAESIYNRGKTLQQLSRLVEALACYARALELRPDFVGALVNSGAVLIDLQQFDEALAFCERALVQEPNNVYALYNQGNLFQYLGRFADAIEIYDQILLLAPNSAPVHTNRGAALQKLIRYEDALNAYEHALRIDPAYTAALGNLAAVLMELGRSGEACSCLERQLALCPDSHTVLHQLGLINFKLHRYAEALDFFARALHLRPGYPEALNDRGNVLKIMRRYEEAALHFEKLVEVAPDFDYGFGNMLRSQMYSCDWRNYENKVTRLNAGANGGKRIDVPFSFVATSDSPQAQLACAATYAAHMFPAITQPLWQGQRYSHKRIRVAYISADFQEHATSYLMAQLFESHDQSNFEVTGISIGPDSGDAMRLRLQRAFTRFIDAQTMSDLEVAQMLCDMEIDIAVDLKGYTFDCRTGIFAYRPAPVQINYLGYPGTMGADYIDYILADEIVIPPEAHAWYAEKVACLPDCYQVNDNTRAIASLGLSRSSVGLPESGFVFCCFNNNYKITPEIFSMWMRLLAKVEGSVLWLLEDNPAASRNLLKEAQRFGIAPDRLIFAPRMRLDQHLARHQLADLFLDTLPYNAHTTASDALWAGLPLVTCCGATFASRVAASLLHAIGLPDLVTRNLAEYEELALRLAKSPADLAEIKRRLQENRNKAPLFDTNRFRTHIEAAYRVMWERVQLGLAPESFSIQPITTPTTTIDAQCERQSHRALPSPHAGEPNGWASIAPL